ncbi:MAG: hypothetical protein ACK4FJ_18690 [Ferrovibrio sp.]|uniref:hypothetical protein n=1 Tax=Ferrovibrio sp. TaxID=1917215 RepID=UPI00391B51C5
MAKNKKDKKDKAPSFLSPRGVFKFPKLSEPDFGTDEYPKPDGEFSVKLILKLDDPKTQAFLAKLKPLHEDAVAKGKEAFKELKAETRKKLKEVKVNDLFTELLDEETEEPTGEIEFKFAMKHSGVYKKGPKEGKKWKRRPDIFDAKGQKITKSIQIWGGTEGKVSFSASPYFIPGTGAAGLKLNLDAVQIISLVSGGSRTASSYGFEEEEGFSADELPEDEDETSGIKGDDDDEDDGDEGASGSSDDDDDEGDF